MKTEEEVKAMLSELEKQRDDLDKHLVVAEILLNFTPTDIKLLIHFYNAKINTLQEVLNIKPELPF